MSALAIIMRAFASWRRRLPVALGVLLVPFVIGAGSPSLAQEPTAPGPSAQVLTQQQIDQLVAPIALYPDNLLGQVLTASTYPLEVVMAARWAQANPNVTGPQLEQAMQMQPWDPSVKALAAVPQTLAMMNDQLDWTKQIGEAYLAQPDDVANAIQRLRARADGAGNLKTTSQVRIRRIPPPPPAPEAIVAAPPPPEYYAIEPVEPDVMFVPVYDPWVVYGVWPWPVYRPFYWYPPGYVAVGVIGFGAPIVVGAAIWANYNWYSRRVDINVVNYNKFNHANLSVAAANQAWKHDPSHRGNIPYSNPKLQQEFRRANANANPGTNQQFLSKTGTGSLGGTGKGALGTGSGGGTGKVTNLGTGAGTGKANLTATGMHLPKNVNSGGGSGGAGSGGGGDRHANVNDLSNTNPGGNNGKPKGNTHQNTNVTRNVSNLGGGGGGGKPLGGGGAKPGGGGAKPGGGGAKPGGGGGGGGKDKGHH